MSQSTMSTLLRIFLLASLLATVSPAIIPQNAVTDSTTQTNPSPQSTSEPPTVADPLRLRKPRPTPPRGDGDQGAAEASAAAMLGRLHERLSVLQTLAEQQLRRFETLEYKLTRLEVQQQERLEGMKTDLREVSRRVQQVDWSVSKMEGNVEAVKQDTSGLRQGQETLRGFQTTGGSQTGVDEQHRDGKINTITASLYGVKGTLTTMQKSMRLVAANVTELANATKAMNTLRDQLVTKQYLTTALLDLKQRSVRPVVDCSRPVGGEPEVEPLPVDCWAVQEAGANRSGIYKIRPAGASREFYAHCQLEAGTYGGGWTVLQHRFDGSVDFYRGWQDFKHGFGNLAGEFWLGLEKIHLLTDTKVQELLIELQDFNDQTAYARYTAFAVATEVEGYALKILGSYHGDAGDCLTYHGGHKFSTFDLDNDGWPDGNCAQTHTGGWWYNTCDNSNLNGKYLNGDLPSEYEYQGMYWYDWHGPHYSLQSSRISIRPYQPRSTNTTESPAKRKTDGARKITGKIEFRAAGVKSTPEPEA